MAGTPDSPLFPPCTGTQLAGSDAQPPGAHSLCWDWAWGRGLTVALLPSPCVTALLLPWRPCRAAVCTPIAAEQVGEQGGDTGPGWLQPLRFLFSSDLSNNKISSLSNSSFTNMSQLTTL